MSLPGPCGCQACLLLLGGAGSDEAITAEPDMHPGVGVGGREQGGNRGWNFEACCTSPAPRLSFAKWGKPVSASPGSSKAGQALDRVEGPPGTPTCAPLFWALSQRATVQSLSAPPCTPPGGPPYWEAWLLGEECSSCPLG